MFLYVFLLSTIVFVLIRLFNLTVVKVQVLLVIPLLRFLMNFLSVGRGKFIRTQVQR